VTDLAVIRAKIADQLSGNGLIEQRFAARQTETGMVAFLNSLPAPAVPTPNVLTFNSWRLRLRSLARRFHRWRREERAGPAGGA
jgi:hypothetical protein